MTPIIDASKTGDTFYRTTATDHTINWCCSESDVAYSKELPSKTSDYFEGTYVRIYMSYAM